MPNRPLEKVLLVDDSSLDNRLHTRVIARTGLVQDILSFTMAHEAIAHFRTPGALPAGLVLLDINMPRMDGFEMLEACIAEFGDLFSPSVVVMLTTSMNPRDRQRAEGYGLIREYLQKPLTEEKFRALYAAVSGS